LLKNIPKGAIMKPNSIIPKDAFLPRNGLGQALITPDPELSHTAILTNVNNLKFYLPLYQNANQTSGGQETFAPTLTNDGTLTFYLNSVVPPELVGQTQKAAPYTSGISLTLMYNQDGQTRNIPLNLKDEGNNIWKASATLNSTQRQEVTTILFNTIPNAIIQVTQTVTLAGQLTEQFVNTNWSVPAIHEKLLSRFAGGIKFPNAEVYYRRATEAYSEFSQQYMKLECSYVSQIGAPSLPGYIKLPVTWKDRVYNYYQDNQKLNRVFFVPDSFKLSTESHGKPSVSLLQFKTEDGTIDNMVATFRFFAEPIAEYTRLENAKEQLAQHIGQELEMVSFQGVKGVSTELTLYLPNVEGTASIPKVQSNADIDLKQGLRNELNLSLKAFQALWEAIFSVAPEQPLFTGWVEIRIEDQKYQERINFDGRLEARQQTNYFDLILDEGTDTTYSKTLTVVTFPKLFEDSNNRIDEISVDFGQETVRFTRPSKEEKEKLMEAKVTVKRSVRDIILGNGDLGVYPYTLQVVNANGRKCYPSKTTSDTIYITEEEIKKCTAENCPS
jgi:hypothetical protein